MEQVAPSALKVINSKATFILKGLQSQGNYSVMLGAQTISGDGPLSLPIFCLTKPSGRHRALNSNSDKNEPIFYPTSGFILNG